MLRSVFLKSLRDHLRGLGWWLVGTVAYIVFIMAFYPTLQANAEILNQYLETFPEAFLAAFMGEFRDITSPSGFLASYVFTLIMPVIVLIYAIVRGGDAVAGEEERGTLELLLANPISRSRVFLEKLASVAVGVGVLGGATWLSVALGARLGRMPLDLWLLAAACAGLALLGLAFGALALAVGAATGKKGTAGGVAAVVGLFSYLMVSFAPSVPALAPYRVVSLFYLYGGAESLETGLDPVRTGVLVAFIVVCIVAGVFFFRRRDLAV